MQVDHNDGYGFTFAEMQEYFASYNPEYVGNIILFNSEQDLGDAIFDLEDVTGLYVNSNTSLTDMGKKLYVGVKGGQSDIFVYTLCKINDTSNSSTAGYVRYFISACNYSSTTLDNALDGYGEVNICRGSA
jgi:hypothetical protein